MSYSFRPLGVVISGGVGSGKSTLASSLSKETGWVTVSFGQYVRDIAEKEQIEPSRENLQHLGASLTEEGWRIFTKRALQHFAWPPNEGVIVEGVRHIEVFEALRDIISPLPITWVFLDTPDMVRLQRQKLRGDTETKDNNVFKHSTETQIEAIKKAAECVIDGTLSKEDVLCKALLHLSRLLEDLN